MLYEHLRQLPDGSAFPRFDRGWANEKGGLDPYVSYLGATSSDGWSSDLEALHADATADHFIDVWTREAVLAALRAAPLPSVPALLDLGCSSGLMTTEIIREWPTADVLGIDAEADGLALAHAMLPSVPFVHASGTDIPLPDCSIDAVVAINVLEHISDDVTALAEMRRVLRPGGRAVVVVPYNPALYDYFDAHLHHERRYARGEMATKGTCTGLHVATIACLGSALYPAFWITKKVHRWRHPSPPDGQRQVLVEHDISATRHARLGRLAHTLERGLLRRGVRPRFGIREVTVFDRTPG